MKFSLPFLVAVAPLVLRLAATIQAVPLPDGQHTHLPRDLDVGLSSRELRAREVPTDGFVHDLFARARKGGAPAPPKKAASSKPAKAPLNPKQLSQRIQNVQKGQTARKEVVNKKNSLNKQTTRQLKKPKTNDPKKMTPADKQAQKAIGKAITNAANDRKVAKYQKWESKKKTPAQAAQNKADKAQRRKDRKATGTAPPPPKAPGKKALAKQERKAITPQERNQVKNAFKAANTKKNKVQNLPGRKDTFEIGKSKFSGKDVRQGAFNAYLHKGHPVGHANNKNPKNFGNRRYPAGHPDASLRGQRPIPAARNGLEYPIKANSHNGYTGSGDVGAGRIILHKNKQDRRKTEYAVIGHDPSRGGDSSDHYLAKHTKAKRELIEDLELGEQAAM